MSSLTLVAIAIGVVFASALGAYLGARHQLLIERRRLGRPPFVRPTTPWPRTEPPFVVDDERSTAHVLRERQTPSPEWDLQQRLGPPFVQAAKPWPPARERCPDCEIWVTSGMLLLHDCKPWNMFQASLRRGVEKARWWS